MSQILRLKKSRCKNCYKCIRNCPVKSIKFSGHQAHILENECILCGKCFVVCPQNAKDVQNDVEKVKVMLMAQDDIIVSLAPSFISGFKGATIDTMEKALKEIGFKAAEETALGATIVKKEYEKMIASKKKSVIISSCCHSVNLLIRKYYKELIPNLADVVSPMIAHAMDIKKRYENCKVVFIGPCISKKHEIEEYENVVDCVLTFDELNELLNDKGIIVEKGNDNNNNSKARLFPTAGGILKTMDCTSEDYEYIVVDGTENCINALNDIKTGKISNCFIEMSSCVGSCIGGPAMINKSISPLQSYLDIVKYAGKEDYNIKKPDTKSLHIEHTYIQNEEIEPTEEDIIEILRKMGKISKADELNCGSCGYDSCREKAIAIYKGKADLTMCLPFLIEKAESFSDNIIGNTPNGVIVVNDSLEIQQINKAALNIVNIRDQAYIMGENISRILDKTLFQKVKDENKNIINREVYLSEYSKCIEQTILYDSIYHIIICIMKDITKQDKQRKEKEEISRKTIQITDNVVEKQMRVVQEIASLLGETTAETKVALTKLKESLKNE